MLESTLVSGVVLIKILIELASATFYFNRIIRNLTGIQTDIGDRFRLGVKFLEIKKEKQVYRESLQKVEDFPYKGVITIQFYILNLFNVRNSSLQSDAPSRKKN